MKKDIKFYIKLFFSTFYLSAFTFGGGYIIIPLMRKMFVEQYGWIEEKEMLDLIAIAQSAPGAIAVNTAVLVGYKLAGWVGAFITMMGTVLPPLIILSIVSLAYTEFSRSPMVKYVLRGMQIGVAAVIIDVVFTMIRALLEEKKRLPILVLIGAFVAAFFLHINVIFIIIICAIIGALEIFHEHHVKKRGAQL